MKKMLAILLALALTLTATGAFAEGMESEAEPEIVEELIETDETEIEAAEEEEAPEALAEDLWAEEAPEEELAEGNPVTPIIPEEKLEWISIGDYYYDLTTILSQNIATTVAYTGSDTAATVPETVTYESKTYRVTRIGTGTFTYDMDIKSVTLPENVTMIDEEAFRACTNLTSVKPGSKLKSIGAKAFFDCEALKELEIPASVTEIADDAFDGSDGNPNPNLNLLIADGDFTYACPVAGDACKVAKYTGSGYTTVPGTFAYAPYKNKTYTVAAIGEGAFQKTDVSYVNLPDSVTEIGKSAFYNCSKLAGVDFGKGVKTIADGAFQSCTALVKVELPDSVESIATFCFQGCTSLSTLNLGKLKTMGASAFAGCTALSRVAIPGTLEVVPAWAFLGCSNLMKLELGDGIKTIGGSPLGGAFATCTALESVEIPDSVTEIGEGAFVGCTGLKNVKIPASVTTIGEHAFDDAVTSSGTPLPDLVIDCPAGSAAEAYAKAAGIPTNPTEPVKLADCTIAPIADQVKTGSAIEPEVVITYGSVTLAKDTDYFVNYVDNVDVGTAKVTITGMGGYTGTVEVTFKILAELVKLEDCTIEPIPAQLFTGAEVRPAVVITYDGKTLAEGADYTLAYADNINKGTAKVTVTGKGGYTGTMALSFAIQDKLNIADAIVEPIPVQAPTGSPVVPALNIRYGATPLVAGTDYDVTYSNNVEEGTATALVTGKGSYEGSFMVPFTIANAPKGTKLKRLSRGKKQITVTWTKQAKGTKGYIIEYSLNSDFSDAKQVKVTKTKITKKVIKKLAAKKKYYVRICTYRVVGGVEVPSEWSAAKSVKTK